MKPTRIEWQRAWDKGEEARRAGKGDDSNPFRHDNTEKGLILSETFSEAWQSQHQRIVKGRA